MLDEMIEVLEERTRLWLLSKEKVAKEAKMPKAKRVHSAAKN
jgi:hypothetical protein